MVSALDSCTPEVAYGTRDHFDNAGLYGYNVHG